LKVLSFSLRFSSCARLLLFADFELLDADFVLTPERWAKLENPTNKLSTANMLINRNNRLFLNIETPKKIELRKVQVNFENDCSFAIKPNEKSMQ
jgi:hypothetical protein